MAKKKKEQEVDLAEDLKILLESDEIEDVVEFVSTGSTFLDYAISNQRNGGIPVGRITELIGENQAGKTLLATHIMAEAQKKGGIAICIDVEHDMDKGFSIRVGLNWDALIYKEYLNSLEEVFGYIEKVIVLTRLKYKNKLIVIVWDSIAATPAAAELEGGYNPTEQVALHARIMSKGLRKIRSAIKSERIAFVATNQLRTKIGVSFGDPTTTSHGKAMSFYASVRMKLVRTGQIKGKDRVMGANCQTKIIKNKVGPPWRVAEFPIYYDYGIAEEASILDFLIDQGVINGKGKQWKTFTTSGGEELKFRSSEWPELMSSNKSLRNEIYDILEGMLVIKFDDKPHDMNIDIDSILEVEQLKSDLDEKNRKEK